MIGDIFFLIADEWYEFGICFEARLPKAPQGRLPPFISFEIICTGNANQLVSREYMTFLRDANVTDTRGLVAFDLSGSIISSLSLRASNASTSS